MSIPCHHLSIQAQLQELEGSTQQLRTAKSNLERQLEEERAAMDGLRTQSSQEAADLTVRLNTLTRELALEQKRSEGLEAEANKVFEAEEQAMVLNEELAASRKKLDQAEKLLDQEQKKYKDLQVTTNRNQAYIFLGNNYLTSLSNSMSFFSDTYLSLTSFLPSPML
jgi:hypothetical protein